MSSIFRFKKFEIDQADCAMKINTDGVLLAATADHDTPRRILDIGTGTGVIALMLAQKFGKAKIYGLEIEPKSSRRSALNFEGSAYKERLEAICMDFLEYQPQADFDLIITNPPFFTNSLKNYNSDKMQARHTDWKFFEHLLYFASTWLTKGGCLQCILPSAAADALSDLAADYGMYMSEEIKISSFEDSEIIRKIVKLKKVESHFVKNSRIVIYEDRGIYTDEYKELLKPYFINF